MPQIGLSPCTVAGKIGANSPSPLPKTSSLANTLAASTNSPAMMSNSPEVKNSTGVLNSLGLLQRNDIQKVYIAYKMESNHNPDQPLALLPSTHGAVRDMIEGGVTIASTTAERAYLRAKTEYPADPVVLTSVDVQGLQAVSLEENLRLNKVHLAQHVGQDWVSTRLLFVAMTMAEVVGEVHIAGVIPPERFQLMQAPDTGSAR